jgi:hypothetical protein
MTMANQARQSDLPPAADRPQTLEHAQLWLDARTPAPDAAPAEHQRFHELSAEIYRHVAVTDPAHKDWARQREIAERQTAGRLDAQIAVRKALVSYLGPDFDASG